MFSKLYSAKGIVSHAVEPCKRLGTNEKGGNTSRPVRESPTFCYRINTLDVVSSSRELKIDVVLNSTNTTNG